MGFGQQRVVPLGGRRWRGCRRATAAHCFDRLRVWRPLRSRSWASHMSVVSTVIQERALAPSFTHPRQQPQQGQPEQPEQHQHQHQRQQGQSEQQEEVHAQRACDDDGWAISRGEWMAAAAGRNNNSGFSISTQYYIATKNQCRNRTVTPNNAGEESRR